MKTIVKITKTGFGSTIGSAFGFGSWTIGATGLEAQVEVDITTEDGKKELKEISNSLALACIKLHELDVENAKKHYPELAKSLERRELVVKNEADSAR
jgi:hypothetical protein